MAKNKVRMHLKGFDEMIKQLDGLGGDIKRATEGCLRVAHDTVTPKIVEDMKRHRRTGRTAGAIVKKATVKWEGTTASVQVGFDLPDGLASVFLIYGTPRIPKDQKLYNDFYGAAAKREISKKQKKIMDGMIRKRM